MQRRSAAPDRNSAPNTSTKLRRDVRWQRKTRVTIRKTHTLYHEQGMGLRIPPGERPAVLIIDMQHDFCDPDAPTTLWPSIRQTYEPIKRLCTQARERNVPVIYTQGLVAADGSSVGCGASNRSSTRRDESRSKEAAAPKSSLSLRRRPATGSSASGGQAPFSAPTLRSFWVLNASTRCSAAARASAVASARR